MPRRKRRSVLPIHVAYSPTSSFRTFTGILFECLFASRDEEALGLSHMRFCTSPSSRPDPSRKTGSQCARFLSLLSVERIFRCSNIAKRLFRLSSLIIALERIILAPMAYVLINTEIGSETDVLKVLKKVEGVKEAYAVYGVYDIIAKITAETMDKLKELVTWQVRRLDKVRSTLTMIVIEET